MSRTRPRSIDKDLPPLGQLAEAERIVAASAQRATPALAPALADAEAALATARTTITELEAARARVRELLAQRKAALAGVRRAVQRLGGAALVEVAGDRAALLSLGLKVARPWTRVPAVGALTGLRAEGGAAPGTVLLRWKSVRSRHGYEVQYCADANGPSEWVSGHASTRARIVIGDLEPGKVYWFRVRPLSSRSDTPWSAPLMVRVG